MQRVNAGRKQNSTNDKLLVAPVKKHAVLLSVFICLHLLAALLIIVSANVRLQFVDEVLAYGRSNQRVVLLLLLNLGVLFLIKIGIPALISLSDNQMAAHISPATERLIQEKKSKILFHYHENPEINDQFELVKDAPEQIWNFWKSVVHVASTIVSALGIFIMLAQLGALLIALLIALFLPVISFSVKAGKNYYSTWKRTAELRRYCDYQRDVLLLKEYAQEKILFGFAPFFMERWEKEYKNVRQLSIKEELYGSKKMQVSGLFFCIYIAVFIFIMFRQLLDGQVSAGYVVSMLSIVPALFNDLIVILSNEINNLIKSASAVRAFEFLCDLDEEEGAFDFPAEGINFSMIEFVGVSFRYPNTENWILRELSFRFEKGKHYALVGENGAGKSTIIKLLLRLYRVTEGAILVDGKNINDMKRAEVTGLVTALFQDSSKYYTNIAENIGLGDMRHIDDMDRIIGSAVMAKLDERIREMPDTYQTVLGTMNDSGIDLSGGEWQKFFIARLIMSPCPIKILDEPAAAMDPVYEYTLYKDFLSIMSDKTTISISHRLASCKNADFIYVIKNGSVCESGTHAILMKERKLYWDMFMTQKSAYC